MKSTCSMRSCLPLPKCHLLFSAALQPCCDFRSELAPHGVLSRLAEFGRQNRCSVIRPRSCSNLGMPFHSGEWSARVYLPAYMYFGLWFQYSIPCLMHILEAPLWKDPASSFACLHACLYSFAHMTPPFLIRESPASTCPTLAPWYPSKWMALACRPSTLSTRPRRAVSLARPTLDFAPKSPGISERRARGSGGEGTRVESFGFRV